MKKGDLVRFRGGVDTFKVYEAPDDDIVLEHELTGRIFSVDYRALEPVIDDLASEPKDKQKWAMTQKPSLTEEELRALIREAICILAFYAAKDTWDNWKDENRRVHPPKGVHDNGLLAQQVLNKVMVKK
jgi:hypothetical protein